MDVYKYKRIYGLSPFVSHPVPAFLATHIYTTLSRSVSFSLPLAFSCSIARSLARSQSHSRSQSRTLALYLALSLSLALTARHRWWGHEDRWATSTSHRASVLMARNTPCTPVLRIKHTHIYIEHTEKMHAHVFLYAQYMYVYDF